MQIRIASLVRLRFEMLPAINLYDQARFKTGKVDNIVINRDLAAKAKAADLPLAQ